MTLDIITLALSGAAALLALLCFLARQKQAATGQDIARLRDEISGELREVRTELVANVHSAIQTTAKLQAEAQSRRRTRRTHASASLPSSLPSARPPFKRR